MSDCERVKIQLVEETIQAKFVEETIRANVVEEVIHCSVDCWLVCSGGTPSDGDHYCGDGTYCGDGSYCGPV